VTARAAAHPPAWPRALRIGLAAAYVGLSEASFLRHCAVQAIQITPGTKAWLREDLDRWLDERAGRVAGSPEVNPWHA
jgi:hypothetical protein